MDTERFQKCLGEAFKLRRDELDLTHEQVSERADISVNYFARIERGEINTSLKKILLIADALDTPSSVIFSHAEKLYKSS